MGHLPQVSLSPSVEEGVENGQGQVVVSLLEADMLPKRYKWLGHMPLRETRLDIFGGRKQPPQR